VAIPFPQLLGNGKDVVQQVFLGANSGMALLFAVLLLKPLATAACLGSGAPGGLFTPTMTYGALLGVVLGHTWALLWPGAPAGSYAVIAAGAVLAATTSGPVSSIVLLAELTHRVDAMMVPLILAVGGAVLVAQRLDPRSIYSARIHGGRARARDRAAAGPTPLGDLLSDRYDVVSAAAPLTEVLAEIVRQGANSRPLYVVDETGRLVGAISPDDLSRRDLSLPPALVTAADLASPVAAMPASASRPEILRRLEATKGAPIVVVDAASGRPVGIVRARGGLSAS
jgi:chloride channel protein, CIC family